MNYISILCTALTLLMMVVSDYISVSDDAFKRNASSALSVGIVGAMSPSQNASTVWEELPSASQMKVPILLNNQEYTYIVEIETGQTQTDRVPFELSRNKIAFLYLQIEDYSEPIGISVYESGTDELAVSSLGATYSKDGVPGTFLSKGEGIYDVQMSRSVTHATQRVVVYGVALDDYTEYEKIELPSAK